MLRGNDGRQDSLVQIFIAMIASAGAPIRWIDAGFAAKEAGTNESGFLIHDNYNHPNSCRASLVCA